MRVNYLVIAIVALLAIAGSSYADNEIVVNDPLIHEGFASKADDSLCCQVMGDANYDLHVDITDLTFMVNYLFSGGPVPPCREQADIVQDCQLDIQDISVIVFYMFSGGIIPQQCQYCPNWH